MATLARFSYRGSPPVDAEDLTLAAAARTGRLVRVDEAGGVFVDFEGNALGPIAAKIAVSDAELADLADGAEGTEILLVFDNGDPTQPIIVGKVRDCLPIGGIEIVVRGRRFAVQADEDLELRCGDAKVRISRDGKVIVLGDEVVSRARRRNRIKGGTVNIN